MTQLSCCAEENAEEKVWKLREEVKEKDMQNEELRRTNKQLEHQISTLEGEDPFVVWCCSLEYYWQHPWSTTHYTFCLFKKLDLTSLNGKLVLSNSTSISW